MTLLRPLLRASLTLACLPAALCSLPAQEPAPSVAVIHVRPSGDDDAPGTSEQPLCTIAAARDRVRELRTSGAMGDVTVLVGGGTYFLGEPLIFSSQDSAPAGAKTTYEAATGEQVILSGGVPLEAWHEREGLWVARLPSIDSLDARIRELFVAGNRATRARSPNEGFYRVATAGPDDRTSIRIAEDQHESLPSEAGAELVFLHDWSTSRVPIAEIDGGQRRLRMAQPIGPDQPHYRISHFEPHPRFFIEGSRDSLDSPGEWHLDAAAGEILYLPRTGERLDEAPAIIPRLEQLIVLRGRSSPSEPVRGLVFRGIEFAHCAWPLPKQGYAAVQACLHEVRDGSGSRGQEMIPAAITCDYSEDCNFDRCRLTHLGGAGIYFRQGCHGNQMIACSLEDCAGNGIMIGETLTRGGVDSQGNPNRPQRISSRQRITDCTVSRCGALYYGAVGIWIGIARENVIEHNEISHMPYTGISVGWNWGSHATACAENRVVANHIHHVMQVLSDGGGIYSVGRQPGTRFEGNLIHDVPLNAGQSESNGIFLDVGSSLIRVEDNTIHSVARSPIRFHRAREITLTRNRLVALPEVSPFRFVHSEEASMSISDNIVVRSESWELPAEDPARSVGTRVTAP